jgi:hypothetical protein
VNVWHKNKKGRKSIMKLKKSWKLITAAVLIGAIAIVAAACSGSSSTPTASPQAAKNLILSSDMVSGGGGCVLNNVYKPGEEVVFRIRVYDPVTGDQMDNKALSSVIISLPDGQTFTANYGGHPSTNPLDHFWATSWAIPDNYPTGTITYTATATAVDGRTGTFDNFNVQPSLLTVVQ